MSAVRRIPFTRKNEARTPTPGPFPGTGKGKSVKVLAPSYPPLSQWRPLHSQRMPLAVILSEVSNANEAEGSRTGSRKRTRYRFRVREALTSYAKVSQGKGETEITKSCLALECEVCLRDVTDSGESE